MGGLKIVLAGAYSTRKFLKNCFENIKSGSDLREA